MKTKFDAPLMWLGLYAILVVPSLTSAAPIVSFSGGYAVGPFGAATGSVMAFTNGSIGSSIASDTTFTVYSPPPLAGSFGVLPTSVNLAGFNINGGPATIMTPMTITETGTGNTAVFNIIAPGTLNLTGLSSGTVDLGFSLQLFSNNTSLDMGALGALWSYNFSFQGLIVTPGTPGTFTVLGAPTGTSSASFTLIRADLLPGGQVPEPASMLAWCVVIGAGALVRRRMMNV